MNPYESGAVIDMNMGHNSTTPAPTGADALRVAAQAALTALENLHEIDTECITIDVQDEIDALRAALASAAQPPITYAPPSPTLGVAHYGPGTSAAPQPPACKTCNDIGMIGGPSYYAPDEGGVPCPDCSAPQPPVAVQEPVAFALRWPSDTRLNLSTVFDTEKEATEYAAQCLGGVLVVPLYTHPAPAAQED